MKVQSEPPADDDPDPWALEHLAYRSADGGRSWERVPLPPLPIMYDQVPNAQSPTVLFDRNGVAYYIVAGSPGSFKYAPPGSSYVYVSRDGGKSWSAPTLIAEPIDVRRQLVAVDRPGRGKLYLFHIVKQK